LSRIKILIHNDLENKNYNPVSPDKKKKSRKTLILRDFFFLPGDNRKTHKPVFTEPEMPKL
jgi:hypothetical protein